MNDRHPSGTATPPTPAPDAVSAHYASYGAHGGQYGEFTTYNDAFGTGGATTATFATDPLFGDLPGHDSTGAYDATQWSTAGHATFGDQAHQAPDYGAYAAQHHAAFDTGAHDTTAWAAGYQQLAGIPAQATSPDASGQWDTHAWLGAGQSADPTQQWEWGTQTFDTGAYDATQWNSAGTAEHGTHDQYPDAADPATAAFEQMVPDPFDQAESFDQAEAFDQQATSGFDAVEAFDQPPYDRTAYEDGELEADEAYGDAPPLLDDQEEIPPAPAPRVAARASNRARRRTPAKRSALLTVAVPSVCVMGVAGIAAASVGVSGEDGTTTSASAATPVKPSAANNKLDSQLESLSAGANDFADRASRTQERIDLKAEQAAEQKKAAAEAALKERLRPKFVLPVLQKGLSAYFGQAGINWMSVHTGIDFPVSYGTTVLAATDGTVRTQWNSAYGNMMIVTAKDGTETWYCHLSTYRVASGTTVKAGEPIAYSGNSGNSTGPHLHFEVRPGGGAAIDPLPWLRSHGLDPT
ncbi:M23 family metallopeptidase [Streptomyces chiangmaiensis]|uniref:M23 family metallopeptidase n=1 Tax=Streptomyces chiangmaiensis TaxID=766497 RepID=A0ABU7FDG8_9ACTN|nr:M23 family metallopeptidase [Streptomyces chiangmaiensis]MED7822134.1 M23 family metallopeptidase [Streptomyces chiangmaiensis]